MISGQTKTPNTVSSCISGSCHARKANIDRIRQSMQHVPLLQQNHDVVKQRLSQSTYDSDHSDDKENGSELLNYELFENKYEIINKLGEGTNGVVHRCKKRSTEKEFAVKSFTFEEEQLPGLKANFLLMKRLKHPNIIKYEALYVDTKKRMGWLVMQFVDLPSLAKEKPKTEDDLKYIMFELIDTLGYLHRQEIVHRDVKPENILYDSENNTIKLIDFGVSKRFRKRGNLTQMWTNTGTLYYRAPELFSGGYREGVDIWAAGILLYKLVAGKTPFESEYHKQTIQNIKGAQLKFPPIFNKYSPQLKSLISGMLQRNDNERLCACSCLADVWLSNVNCPTLRSRRSQNALNDLGSERFQHDHKKETKANMSLAIRLDDYAEDCPELTSVRPYICTVEGHEIHCIDSQWK